MTYSLTIDQIKKYIREMPYMSGVDRDRLRVNETNEVFTPTWLVQKILDEFEQTIFTDATKTFLDPTCGDGQSLGEVLIRKLENGIDFETALSTIYGVDLMPDNVQLCRDRLLCGQEHLRHIVERNIVCHDALTYDYSFNGTNFTDAELREQKLALSGITVKKQEKARKKEAVVIDNPSLWE